MKNVVVRLEDGDVETHNLPHGGWVVDDNGVLHVQDANFRKYASYAPGRWVDVK